MFCITDDVLCAVIVRQCSNNPRISITKAAKNIGMINSSTVFPRNIRPIIHPSKASRMTPSAAAIMPIRTEKAMRPLTSLVNDQSRFSNCIISS